MARNTGTVKWFSKEKGYGFIQREGREDVFVHHSQISMEGYRTLDAGEEVDFEIVSGDRGPKARDVQRSGASRIGGIATARGTPVGGAKTLLARLRGKLGWSRN